MRDLKKGKYTKTDNEIILYYTYDPYMLVRIIFYYACHMLLVYPIVSHY